MKRIINTAIVGLLCIALACPTADARGRNNNQQNTSQSTKAPARPNNGNGNQNHPNNGNQGRPNNGNQNRPNNGNYRPGGNTPSNNRPTNVNPPHNNHGPAGPGAQPPKPGGNHGFMPGGNHHPQYGGVPNFAPHRPMMPAPRPFARPVPPPSFRPHPQGPSFGTILGIALGSAINASLEHLLYNGYSVTGYTNEAVYLNDVMMLNMLWPNTTLYYDRGRLAASEFVYWTLGANSNRYYQTYNILTSSYGYPISTRSYPSGGMQSSWFGPDGRFVTLQYMPERSIDGQWRYFTTLSFGN